MVLRSCLEGHGNNHNKQIEFNHYIYKALAQPIILILCIDTDSYELKPVYVKKDKKPLVITSRGLLTKPKESYFYNFEIWYLINRSILDYFADKNMQPKLIAIINRGTAINFEFSSKQSKIFANYLKKLDTSDCEKEDK